MDEKTVADLWDAIKALREDIAALQDRLDGFEEFRERAFERHEDTHAREQEDRDRETRYWEDRIARLENAR